MRSATRFLTQWIVPCIGMFSVAFILTACSANNDAMHVVESENVSLRATVAAYDSMGPTATAQTEAMVQLVATSQMELVSSRATNAALVARLNSNLITPDAVDPNASSSDPNANANTNPVDPATQLTPTSTATGLSFASVVTAKGNNASGCSVNETSTFSTSDTKIWVVADVHNYKKGTVFDAKWTDGNSFNYDSTWTVPRDGTQICVHFYIEPKTLSLMSGNYTVTLSAPGVTPQQVNFVLQPPGATPAANATASQ